MAELITGVIFSVIGMGFFVYGKKQKHVPAFLAAIGLFTIPYFISNIYILILVGICLIFVPFFVNF